MTRSTTPGATRSRRVQPSRHPASRWAAPAHSCMHAAGRLPQPAQSGPGGVLTSRRRGAPTDGGRAHPRAKSAWLLCVATCRQVARRSDASASKHRQQRGVGSAVPGWGCQPASKAKACASKATLRHDHSVQKLCSDSWEAALASSEQLCTPIRSVVSWPLRVRTRHTR